MRGILESLPGLAGKLEDFHKISNTKTETHRTGKTLKTNMGFVLRADCGEVGLYLL